MYKFCGITTYMYMYLKTLHSSSLLDYQNEIHWPMYKCINACQFKTFYQSLINQNSHPHWVHNILVVSECMFTFIVNYVALQRWPSLLPLPYPPPSSSWPPSLFLFPCLPSTSFSACLFWICSNSSAVRIRLLDTVCAFFSLSSLLICGSSSWTSSFLIYKSVEDCI